MATASRLVDPGLADIDDFDTIMVVMRTECGRQCHINCCREAIYGYDQRLEIFGSNGMLLNDNPRPTTVRSGGGPKPTCASRFSISFANGTPRRMRLNSTALSTL